MLSEDFSEEVGLEQKVLVRVRARQGGNKGEEGDSRSVTVTRNRLAQRSGNSQHGWHPRG